MIVIEVTIEVSISSERRRLLIAKGGRNHTESTHGTVHHTINRLVAHHQANTSSERVLMPFTSAAGEAG